MLLPLLPVGMVGGYTVAVVGSSSTVAFPAEGSDVENEPSLGHSSDVEMPSKLDATLDPGAATPLVVVDCCASVTGPEGRWGG